MPTPRMKNAWSLYDAGDIVGARAQAEALVAGAPSPDVPAEERREAEELLTRTRFPNVAFLWGGIAAGLILLMALLASVRGH